MTDKKIKNKLITSKKNTKKIIKKPIKPTSSNNKSHKELVNLFLKLLIIIKVYHWKTHSYAEHKATDELYSKLNENIDEFVEILLGKDGSRLNMKGCKIDISDPASTKELIKIINEYKILLENKINKYISKTGNSDLYNIRDEILGNLNQFLYLLTFN